MRQPTVTSPLHALVAAVPADRLRELVLELLNGSIAPKPAPATPVRRRAAKRRRGWPLGKPRRPRSQSRAGRRGSTRAAGPDGSPEKRVGRRRKVPAKASHEGKPPRARAIAAVTAHPEKSNRAIADQIGVSTQTVWRARRGPGRPRKPETGTQAKAKLAALRSRRAELQRRWRAKRAKRPSTNAQEQAAAKQAKNRKAKASNANGTTEITPAQLWEHAARISPKTPWKAVARELGANEVQARDCFRNGTMIPGIAAIAAARFCELPA
jgi:hypothetical protein